MDFIKEFNKIVPSVNELILRYKQRVGVELDLETAKKYQSKMIVVKETSYSEENLMNLILKTNFWQVGVGSLTFESSLKKFDCDYSIIGQYSDSYILSKGKEGVFIELNGSINPVFNKEEDFLEFLLFYKKLNVSKFYKNQPINDFIAQIDSWIVKDLSNVFITELFYELGYSPN